MEGVKQMFLLRKLKKKTMGVIKEWKRKTERDKVLHHLWSKTRQKIKN